MRHSLTSAFAITFLGGGLLLTVGASNACTHHDCDPDQGRVCESISVWTTCSRGEDGSTTLFRHECPTGQTCDTTVSTSIPCNGKPVGASCIVDDDCASNLRCESSVCAGPPAEAIGVCNSAPTVVIPDDGSSVDVHVNLDTDVTLLETMTRPICLSLDADNRFGGMGFITVAPESGRISSLSIDYSQASDVAAVGEVSCTNLYARAPALNVACLGKGPAFFVEPNQAKPTFTLVVIAARNAITSDVHLRLHR